jgi:hypothetical protein
MWLDLKYLENNFLGIVGGHVFISPKRFRNFLKSVIRKLIFQKLFEMLSQMLRLKILDLSFV